MYIEAELVFKSYKPLKLELGMFFINKVLLPVEAVELFELDEYPTDEEAFITKYGYPVEMYIIVQVNSYTTPIILASPTEIGWMDDGPDTDELRDITLEDINTIVNDFGGWLFIDVDENEDATVVEGKVIISFSDNEELSCDNCGSTDIIQNSSGDIMCENCGWDENED